jgi:mono/diheme cytochrome c family protein
MLHCHPVLHLSTGMMTEFAIASWSLVTEVGTLFGGVYVPRCRHSMAEAQRRPGRIKVQNCLKYMGDFIVRKWVIGAAAATTVAVAGWYWAQNHAVQNEGAAITPSGISEASGTPLVEVGLPTSFSAQAQQGETYYNSVCAACHGINAAGQDGIAPPLVHKIYEPSHHGDGAFIAAARNGVRAHHWTFGNMPPVKEPLTDAELSAIIVYVRELQRANGIN